MSAHPPRFSRSTSFALITLAYAVGLAVAWGVARAVGWDTPWKTVLYADLAATIAVFAFSYGLDNTSVYDAYWSVIPPAAAPHARGSVHRLGHRNRRRRPGRRLRQGPAHRRAARGRQGPL
jgi:RsiW-degrading membrane proteinase PrsW (M82 family)